MLAIPQTTRTMFKNIFTTAIRSFLRQKGFSILNILGLAIGLSVSMLIIIKVSFELRYDKFHKDYNYICRIVSDINNGGQEIKVGMAPAIIAPELKKGYPEVVDYTRIYFMGESLPVKYSTNVFNNAKVIYADTTFFQFFSFELITGDSKTALQVAENVVISTSWATKLFGKESPIGQRIKVGAEKEKTVTGIFKDFPKNSSINTDFIIGLSDYPDQRQLTNWLGFEIFNYIKLRPDANPENVNKAITSLIEKNVQVKEYNDAGFVFKFFLQPLKKIHLYSDRMGDSGFSVGYIYLYLSIAIIVLLLAIINFTNLTTAKSMVRAKEVAIRKVVGSKRSLLVYQFLGESLILSIIAFVIGLLIVELTLPWFGKITGATLAFNLLRDIDLSLLFLGIALFVGVLAGLYPSLILSKFSPIIVFNKLGKKGKGSILLRNGLIVFQFTATVCLMICTITVYNQLQFIRSKQLGFDRENVLVIPLNNISKGVSPKTLKSEVENIPVVKSASLSVSTPVSNLSARDFQVSSEPQDKPLMLPFCVADFDFYKTLGLKVTQGRGFSKEFPTDDSTVMVNEALVKRFGWKDPLSMSIGSRGKMLKIIGVVSDFNFEDLRQVVKPMIIIPDQNASAYLIVKIHEGNPVEAIEKIKTVWWKLGNEFEPNITMVKDIVSSMYTTDQSLASGFLFLTIIAITIACLGLVGLAAYISESRVKEVGIRKTLGGTATQIVVTLSMLFIKLIAFANIIAVPLSVYAMNRWLNNFAYKTSLNWGFIALAVIMSFVIAILSISVLTIKVATRNPVDSLKYE